MIGGMRHRLALQKPVQTADGGGGFTLSWSTVETVGGSIAPPRKAFLSSSSIGGARGGERFQFGQMTNPVTHSAQIRYRSDIDTTWRVLFDGRTFNVRAKFDPDERKNWLILLLEEGVAT